MFHQVDFNSSKSELSTKKLWKKAEKAMKAEVKAKLYSNFVKSGTLTGGKMEEDGEAENDYVEDKVSCNHDISPLYPS